VADLADTFGALADPTRVRILYALAQRSLCVRDLASLVGVSESAVSHQLRLLRDRRLVKPRRSGTIVRYQADDHHVAALFREAEHHRDHVRSALPDHPCPQAAMPNGGLAGSPSPDLASASRAADESCEGDQLC
jgi:ArsR family transcriptional regulator, lead/cadmium/zinc/bismuth-responsive transcriptional repressor